MLAALSEDYIYELRVEPDCRLVLAWAGGGIANVTGYAAEEVQEKGGWLALIEEQDWPVVRRRNQQLLGGREASAEYRIRARDGSVRWLRDVARPVCAPDSELVVAVHGLARDITTERREAGLGASRTHVQDVLAALADAVLCVLDEGRLIARVAGRRDLPLADALQASTGRPIDEALGLGSGRAWHHHLDRVVPGGDPIRFRLDEM
jgi:PAS domain S-box-containing protein